ncbi:lamin tail domain-containing protein [Haladaptatus pallidirubidus]|uniref:lamin tail domain-containing protein n=1 Tax=Haladaptatus pallidirubidus TaxID=1008152 RepID=UPI001D1084A2|nr:lamin tail domain-containing protein [Haladaptatus pallidirubidus]
MQRRNYLKLLGSTAGALSIGAQPTIAADSALDCGVWYDGEITDSIDGDTFDVKVYSNSTTYNVRCLGIDTPEKSGNTRYEKTEEWEFIESITHLENWGNKASQFAKDELPVGTKCQVKLDCQSEEIDQYDRLLAKIRYDRDANGTMDTVWNELALKKGYARVYAASMSNTDEYLGHQESARANGNGVWGGADGSASEWRNNDVAQTFHPHTSSIKTTNGQVADSRVPVWTEPEAVQENTGSGTIDYSSGNIPIVGVDETNNLAYFGGVPINESWESDSDALEHFVFVTNLIDYLNNSTDPSGPVLVDGGHHTFNQDNAISGEDVAYYQRYLEGVGIELHSINSYGDSTGYSLSEARALIASSSPDAWTSSEINEVNTFISNGGAVILMGSGSESASERATLDDLAAGVGTDLRLNYDDVRDDTNNVGNRKLLKTANLNTTDFSLWSAYGSSSGGGTDESVIEFGTVNQYPHSTLNDEYVDVTNTGSADQDMTGWTLGNADGDTYSLPDNFTLTAGGTVRVHTGSGTDTTTDGDLYWGASMFQWDNDSDTASLYDDTGTLVRDVSWSLEDVIIPAIDAANEWVDFKNVSADSVDMTGWIVEDEAGNTYTFPSGFNLASDNTVRLHSGSGSDTTTDLYWGRSSSVWNNDGDTTYLYDANGNLVQKRTYPAPYSVSVTDMSLDGSTLNDEWVDVKNDGSSLLDMSGFTLEDSAGYTYSFPDSFTLSTGDTVRVHTGSGTDTITDLYWGRGSGVWNNDGDTAYVYDDNEVLAEKQASSNLGSSCGSKICVGQISEDGSTLNDEWVEFDNTGSSDQDMTDWSVEDSAGHHYDFPNNYTLTSGGTVRLHTGSGTDSSTDGDLYWSSGSAIWNNSGDTVYLYDSSGNLHTEKSY